MNLYLGFSLMLGVSFIWLAWFLYRPLKDNHIDLKKSNIALGKQRQIELKQDLERDLIDKPSFETAQDEIAQTLALELEQDTSQTLKNNQSNNGSLIFIALFLFLLSFGAYDMLSPDKSKAESVEQEVATLTLDESVIKLKEHLQKNPEDSSSWQILGLTYFELNRLSESAEAYDKSYQLDASNVRTLVEYATTLARLKGGDFTGRPTELVKSALAIDPNSLDAVYLTGLIAANQQDFKTAEKLWKQALMRLPIDDPNRQDLQIMLEKVQGISASHQIGEGALMVDVVIPESLMKTRSENDYLMVYAKSATGRPMPIAIEKVRLKDFSGNVVLSDQNSVIPSRPLSKAKEIVVVARISQTGNAMKQPDDVDFSSDPFLLKGTSRVLLDMTPEIETQESLSLKDSVQNLIARTQDNPDDIEAWTLLGYSYISLGENEKGVTAYNTARKLDPNNVSLMIENASILAQLQNDQYHGEPIELVNLALQLEPSNVEALWRLGLYQYQQNNIDTAISTWENTLSLMSSQSPAKAALMKTLVTVKARHSGVTEKNSEIKLTVNVDIDSAILENSLQDNDFIMVYVRAASGMPIPIAIEKMSLKDFSGTVILSDENSVMPSRLLSQADKMIAVARITKTGQAIRQAGDIEVRSQPFALKKTTKIDLNIK